MGIDQGSRARATETIAKKTHDPSEFCCFYRIKRRKFAASKGKSPVKNPNATAADTRQKPQTRTSELSNNANHETETAQPHTGQTQPQRGGKKMRTIQIPLFKLQELSPEAQKNAFAQYVRKHQQWPCNWAREIIESRDAVLRAVGATQGRYHWVFCHDVAELKGDEARAWLDRCTEWAKLLENEGLALTGFCFDSELSETFIQSLANGCSLWECVNAVEFKAAQIQDEEKGDELSLPYFTEYAEDKGLEFTENGVLFCETL